MTRGHQPLGIGTGVTRFTPAFRVALAQSPKSRGYSQVLQEHSSEFSVEIERLSAPGVTASNFRWPVKKGCVERAHEVTHLDGAVRRVSIASKSCLHEGDVPPLDEGQLGRARSTIGLLLLGAAALQSTSSESGIQGPPGNNHPFVLQQQHP
jgi:hypothetical protein